MHFSEHNRNVAEYVIKSESSNDNLVGCMRTIYNDNLKK